ncbi:hypothetical protein UlMin_002487 [Ulmus minor]
MASFAKLVSIFFFLYSSYLPRKTTAKSCPTRYCSSASSIPVKFPFRIASQYQDPRCGYPGFDLLCQNYLNRTTITLPSGVFVVRSINYGNQILTIRDPQNCLPERLLAQNFTVWATPFRVANFERLTFLNSSLTATVAGDESVPIDCLSGINFTIKVVPSDIFTSPPPSCEVISEALMPLTTTSLRWLDTWQYYLYPDIVLNWDEPSCNDCYLHGGDCGFSSDTGPEVRCFNTAKNGISKGLSYFHYTLGGIGIIILIGILWMRSRTDQLLAANRESSTERTRVNQNSASIVATGLDETIIGSYPKTLIGESRRLPKANDNTCSICLSEYKAKEVLRTIPDCGHYFHDVCIVKWLRLNAMCPLCRNLPQRSTVG